jgi:hypothetical protein
MSCRKYAVTYIARTAMDLCNRDSKQEDSGVTEDKNSSVKHDALGCFGRYLTLWVLLCMIVGTLIGEKYMCSRRRASHTRACTYTPIHIISIYMLMHICV